MVTRTARLLLAEDESAVAEPLVSALEAEGHAVTWVRSSRELRSEMAESSPDLLLLDTSLDTDGLEYLQAIRFAPDHPRAGVVAMTGSVPERDRALQLGAVAALAKPVQVPAVTDLVDELLSLT